MLCGIAYSFQNLRSIVLLIESSHRASYDTLTAVDAGRLTERKIEGRSDLCVVTAVNGADGTDFLEIGAGSYTATAKDTLVVIADDSGRGSVKRLFFLLCCREVIFVTAEVACELLKLAVGGTDAGEALLLVSGKNELDVHLAGCSYLLGVCEHLHTLVYGVYAGGNETSCSLNLNKAKAASADLIDILEIAECGNFDSCILCSLKHCDTGGNGIVRAVDLYIYHIHVLFCSFLISLR